MKQWRWPKRNRRTCRKILWPTIQSMVKINHLFTKPKSWNHLEVNFHMELTMEHMINLMNQLILHLLQLKVSKNINLKKDVSTIQCYKCQEIRFIIQENVQTCQPCLLKKMWVILCDYIFLIIFSNYMNHEVNYSY